MKGTSLWTRDFTLTILANSAGFFGVQVLYPTMPLFLLELGIIPSQIGLIMGLFTLSAFVSRPLAVYGSHRWGRFPMMILGTLLSLLSVASYYWNGSVEEIILPRVIHGFSFGILTTVFAGAVSDMLPHGRRGEGMGYFGLGVSLTMTVAPFLGIFLIEEYSFLSMFMVATATQLLAFLMIFLVDRKIWLFPDAPEKSRSSEEIGKQSWFPRTFWLPGFLTLLFGIGMGNIQSYVSIYAKSEGISGVGWYFVLSSLAICLIRLVSGTIFDKRGPYWILIPSAFFLLAGIGALYYGKNQWLFFASAIFFGIGSGALFPALQAWMVNRSSEERRTGANAVFYNCLDIGVGGGIIFMGQLAEKIGYRGMYGWDIGIMGLFLLVCLMGYYFHEKERKTLHRS